MTGEIPISVQVLPELDEEAQRAPDVQQKEDNWHPGQLAICPGHRLNNVGEEILAA